MRSFRTSGTNALLSAPASQCCGIGHLAHCRRWSGRAREALGAASPRREPHARCRPMLSVLPARGSNSGVRSSSHAFAVEGHERSANAFSSSCRWHRRLACKHGFVDVAHPGREGSSRSPRRDTCGWPSRAAAPPVARRCRAQLEGRTPLACGARPGARRQSGSRTACNVPSIMFVREMSLALRLDLLSARRGLVRSRRGPAQRCLPSPRRGRGDACVAASPIADGAMREPETGRSSLL